MNPLRQTFAKQILVAAVFLLTAGGALQSQKPFEGTLTYSWKMMGSGVEAYAAMMPESMTISMRGDMTHMVMQGGMLASMLGTMIVDSKKEEMYMVREAEKLAYQFSTKVTTGIATDAPAPKIEKLDEKVTIAGYECEKYEVTKVEMGMEQKYFVWATEALGSPGRSLAQNSMASSLSVEGLNGMVLKVMISQANMGIDMTMVLTVTEVKTSKPSSAIFKVPKGYKIEKKTMEEMGALFGG